MEVMATWCTKEGVAGCVKTLPHFLVSIPARLSGTCASAWPLIVHSVAMANTMPQSNLGVTGFIWLIRPCQKSTIEGSEDRD